MWVWSLSTDRNYNMKFVDFLGILKKTYFGKIKNSIEVGNQREVAKQMRPLALLIINSFQIKITFYFIF